MPGLSNILKASGLVIAALLIANATMPADAADGVISLRASATAAVSTAGYWTPERMQAAQPLVMENNGTFSASTTTYDVPRPATVVPGAPPTETFDPSAVQQLFEPLPESGAEPALAGTAFNYPYTVARLYPRPSTLFRAYPYAVVGQLFFSINGSPFVCSASVIRFRVIATAGHCVADGRGNFYSNWLFVPALHGGIAPFLSWTWNNVFTTGNWYFGGGGVPNAQDDALIVLQDQVYRRVLHRIGEITGYLGYEFAAALPTHITQLGYPCNLDSCSDPIADNAQLYSGPTNNREWGSAEFGGASGGPEIQDFGQAASGTPAEVLGGNILVSVTSYTYTDPAIQVDGGSVLQAAGFSGGGFGDLINNACGVAAGNC